MSQQAGAGRTVMVAGRIVWTSGNLFTGRQKTDQQTKLPRRNAAGEIMMEYGFGLAVMKSSLQQTGPGQPGEIWSAMHAEALTLYPNGQIPPSFAMKYKDGDSVDDKGVLFSQREGYAGHVVFACTTALPIKYFKWENGGNVLINEGIKCGDYVNVQLQIKAHPAHGQGKAGLYLNPNMVQLLGYGKEIVNTPNGDAVFGAVQPGLPAGASAMPVASGPMPTQPVNQAPQGWAAPPPQAPQMPPQGYAQPGAPSYAPPMPAAAPQPHYGVMPPAHQPPPGGMPAPMPPQAPPQQWGPPAAPAAPQYQQPQQPGGFPPVPQ